MDVRTDELDLIQKLRSVEALHARTMYQGERDAAANAIEAIKRRLKECEQNDPPIEYSFSMSDRWSRNLFLALLRRYGIEPYRYPRQRRTTVMAHVSKKFVDETLWPEFKELSSTLDDYLSEVTDRVIREAIHDDTSEETTHAARGLPSSPK